MIQKEAFSCARDGMTIRGCSFRPEEENLPILICSHGFMGNYEPMLHIAERYAQQGYFTIAYDFNGGGVNCHSDPDSSKMTVLTEVADLGAVVDQAKSLPFTSDRVILMGASQGGFVSALYAARHPGEIEKLILFYPALCIPDDARKGQMLMFQFDPENIPDIVMEQPMRLGGCYPRAVIGMDAFREIAPYPGPVLIVHGTADNIVSADYAIRAQETYHDARLTIIEGGDHGFSQPEHERIALEAMEHFLAGREEMLTIDVRLTGFRQKYKGTTKHISIPFTGQAIGPYFRGNIQSGACDEQVYTLGGAPISMCADYYIQGEAGTVHVQNRSTDGKHWQPTVSAEGVLDDFDLEHCHTLFEMRKDGPLIRIFAKRKM